MRKTLKIRNARGKIEDTSAKFEEMAKKDKRNEQNNLKMVAKIIFSSSKNDSGHIVCSRITWITRSRWSLHTRSVRFKKGNDVKLRPHAIHSAQRFYEVHNNSDQLISDHIRNTNTSHIISLSFHLLLHISMNANKLAFVDTIFSSYPPPPITIKYQLQLNSLRR